MAKDWTLVGTNDLNFGNTESERDKVKRLQKFQKAIRNVKSLSYEDLEKQSKTRYEQTLVNDAALIQAYDEKKLKSEGLIKKAKALKKKAEAAAAKKQNKNAKK